MTELTPPYREDSETGVLGALLLAPGGLPGILATERLRPEHFYRPRHQSIFAAMVALHDRGDAIDAATVSAELDREQVEVTPAFVHSLSAVVPAVGSLRRYAQDVIEDARFREVGSAAFALVDAAGRRDMGAVIDAQTRLSGVGQRASRRRTATERQEAVADIIEGQGKVWRTPFLRLNELLAGGFRSGQFTTLAGWPGHGKSAIVTQMLNHFASQGAKCALYSNEMEGWEIDTREVARLSGIPYWRLIQNKIRDHETEGFAKAIRKVGSAFELIEAAGMTADDIAYDVRLEGWDVAVVDLLNGLPNATETKDIDHNVIALTTCCRQSGAHIIAAQHLNQARHVGKAYFPEPAPSDIRGSGAMYNLSNYVLFVHLKESDSEPGEAGTDGILRLAKARGGIRGRVEVVFDPGRMRFLPPADLGVVGTVAA